MLQRPPDPERAPPTSGTLARVRLLEPIGSLPRSPQRFIWTKDPDASDYLVQLFGRNDVVLFEDITSDTTLRLPSGAVDWNIIATATWRVTPLYGEKTGTPSDTVRFVLDTP
jgi:hypothetical protein